MLCSPTWTGRAGEGGAPAARPRFGSTARATPSQPPRATLQAGRGGGSAGVSSAAVIARLKARDSAPADGPVAGVQEAASQAQVRRCARGALPARRRTPARDHARCMRFLCNATHQLPPAWRSVCCALCCRGASVHLHADEELQVYLERCTKATVQQITSDEGQLQWVGQQSRRMSTTSHLSATSLPRHLPSAPPTPEIVCHVRSSVVPYALTGSCAVQDVLAQVVAYLSNQPGGCATSERILTEFATAAERVGPVLFRQTLKQAAALDKRRGLWVLRPAFQ